MTEITVQIFDSFEIAQEKLYRLGFKRIDEFMVEDYYFSKFSLNELITMKYHEIINNTIVIRKFYDNERILQQKISYKNKELDNLGNIINESKVEVCIDDINNCKKLFDCSGMVNWCEMYNHVFTYQKDELVLDLHCVKDLGLFLECEENEKIKDLSGEEKFKILSNIIKNFDLKIGNDFSCKKAYLKFKNENKLI